MLHNKSTRHNIHLLLVSILLLKIIPSSPFLLQTKRKISYHHGREASSVEIGGNVESDRSNVYELIEKAPVINPSTNAACKALEGLLSSSINGPLGAMQGIFGAQDNAYDYLLVIIMPQLGDFDSAEYAELISAIQQDLKNNKIALRIIGLGDTASAKKFATFSGLSLDSIRVDPTGRIHGALNLHRGPNWDVPSFIPGPVLEWFADYCGAQEANDGTRDVNAIARSWLNYMAMCAGISAPDTLPEIIRGYIGDKEAPERLRADDVVTVPASNNENSNEPFIKIKGITDVKLGPIEYQSLWKNEEGYQRPAELATVRLRFMVEVLSNFGTYVPDQRYLDYRGATFLFGGERMNQIVYEHIDTGVLSYSKTMKRPLSFLEPYIGKKALNPLELGDPIKSL